MSADDADRHYQDVGQDETSAKYGLAACMHSIIVRLTRLRAEWFVVINAVLA